MYKRIAICIIVCLSFCEINAQDFNYSFISNNKSYTEIDKNGKVVDSYVWHLTNTKVSLSKDKCIVIENSKKSEYKIISSEIKFDKLTNVNIKAVRNKINYELELGVIDKNNFFFSIIGGRKTFIYHTKKINKK